MTGCVGLPFAERCIRAPTFLQWPEQRRCRFTTSILVPTSPRDAGFRAGLRRGRGVGVGVSIAAAAHPALAGFVGGGFGEPYIAKHPETPHSL
jgi:hypothetical protein